jgi:hypothetical protein
MLHVSQRLFVLPVSEVSVCFAADRCRNLGRACTGGQTHTGLRVLPILFLLSFYEIGSALKTLGSLVLMTVIGLVVLWSCYGFRAVSSLATESVV